LGSAWRDSLTCKSYLSAVHPGVAHKLLRNCLHTELRFISLISLQAIVKRSISHTLWGRLQLKWGTVGISKLVYDQYEVYHWLSRRPKIRIGKTRLRYDT
jgi:hypothetical protein